MIIDIEREKRTSFISSEWRSSEYGVWEKRQTRISRIDNKKKYSHRLSQTNTDVKAKKEEKQAHRENAENAKKN